MSEIVDMFIFVIESYIFHKLNTTFWWDQANHRLTTTMQRRLYGHATDVEIRPLDAEKAVQASVDLIGEMFVFSVINHSCYLPIYM